MQVALFISCLADLFYPEIGLATVDVLRRAGVEVFFPPGQTCCGQVAFNTGYQSEARELAEHFVQVFESAPAIVSPTGSCVAMVRREYPGLFQGARMRARVKGVVARTYELSEFLVQVLNVEDLGAEWHGRVTYHDACHLNRGLKVHDEPRRLLRHVRGLELVEMERSNWCCGFGGTFSVKMPDVSVAIAEHKEHLAQATGVDTLVTSDAACMMHLAGYFRRERFPLRVLHFAQVLAGAGSDRPMRQNHG
jgi:L-lactate dehydrogenase complex protein LldE